MGYESNTSPNDPNLPIQGRTPDRLTKPNLIYTSRSKETLATILIFKFTDTIFPVPILKYHLQVTQSFPNFDSRTITSKLWLEEKFSVQKIKENRKVNEYNSNGPKLLSSITFLFLFLYLFFHQIFDTNIALNFKIFTWRM